MISRSLTQIQEMLEQQWVRTHVPSLVNKNDNDIENADTSRYIQGVSTDSRTLSTGNLFIPLVGDQFDGHFYVEQAIELGASAVLWQSDHLEPPKHLPVPVLVVKDTLHALQQLAIAYRKQLTVKIIGITGSNGKTTTKDILASLLATTYRVHKTMGNLNNHIGVPLTILSMKEDDEFAVLEMGMSGRGEIARLSYIAQPHAVMITMIGEAHLMQLGTREAIAQAKLEILQGVSAEGLFVYHGDEPLLNHAIGTINLPNTLKLLTFGRTPQNDFYPKEIKFHNEGTRFMINQADFPELYMPLLGDHNVINALAAIATAIHFKVTPTSIQQGLQAIQLTSMRIEKIIAPAGFTILNDAYNASPSSMNAALELVEKLQGYQRKIIVLGDMLELGDHEIVFHQAIGKRCTHKKFDYVFTYGQLAKYIANEAIPSFPPGHVQAFDDKQHLVLTLSKLVTQDDVVLVKGSRGMRLEDVVKGLCS